MIIQKEWEIFEIRVEEDKEQGYAHNEKVRIAGERVYFKGFEEFKFAIDARVHLAHHPWAEEDAELYEVAWYVTELRSGAKICAGQATKDKAIAESQNVLDSKGVDATRKAIAKKMAMVGAA